MKKWIFYGLSGIGFFSGIHAQYVWVGLPEPHQARAVFFSGPQSPNQLFWELRKDNDKIRIPCNQIDLGVFSCIAHSLSENTDYQYRIISGERSLAQGQFTTLTQSPVSFRFTAGACSFLPGNPIYTYMLQEGGKFHINCGDLHYSDIASTNYKDHLNAFPRVVLSGKPEQAFFAQTPIFYVWDDHDFCGNNSSGPSPCADAAIKAFQLGVPSGNLPLPVDGIHQAFSQGRIRFIMPDLRSNRSHGRLLSETGMQWLENELKNAASANQFPVIVSSVPYLGDESDNWGGAPAQRKKLAGWIKQYFDNKALFICGDAHMAAIDNGENSRLADSDAGPGPVVVQVAALIGFGSDKGGNYSEGGSFPNPVGAMQYASFSVLDDGGNAIAWKISIHRISYISGKQKSLAEYIAVYPMPGNPAALGWNPQTRNLHFEENEIPARYILRNQFGKIVKQDWIHEAGTYTISNENARYLEVSTPSAHWVRTLD